MKTFYERRQVLSEALLPHFHQNLERYHHSDFPMMEGGGALLTPETTPIKAGDSLETMSQVTSVKIGRQDGQTRYVALVIQPGKGGLVGVSILTNPHTPRHVVEIEGEDMTTAIPHLKELITETFDTLWGAE